MNTTHESQLDNVEEDFDGNLAIEARALASLCARANAARRSNVTFRLNFDAADAHRSGRPIRRLVAMR